MAKNMYNAKNKFEDINDVGKVVENMLNLENMVQNRHNVKIHIINIYIAKLWLKICITWKNRLANISIIFLSWVCVFNVDSITAIMECNSTIVSAVFQDRSQASLAGHVGHWASPRVL